MTKRRRPAPCMLLRRPYSAAMRCTLLASCLPIRSKACTESRHICMPVTYSIGMP